MFIIYTDNKYEMVDGNDTARTKYCKYNSFCFV